MTDDKGKGQEQEQAEIPVHCAHTEMVPMEKLVPNPRNPNKHPDKQIQMLAKIIMVQGWRAPITVSRQSGFIVRGHGRYAAGQLAGCPEAPVDYQDYQSEAEEWADLIADNRIAELAQMDTLVLKDLLLEIDTGAIDMNITGFDDKSLEALMTIEGPPKDVKFKEYDETAGDDVKTATCPKCGEEFPV